jgi:hypothetical protein
LVVGPRQFEHFVVVELLSKYSQLAKKSKSLKAVSGLADARAEGVVEELLAEVMLARAAPLDLDEVGGREDGAEQAEVEDVGAVVAGGHHADGDADPRLAGLVGGDEVARAEQVVVGEVDGELLGVGDLGGDLHGKVGLVLAGEHAVGHLVEDLRQFGGVVLADGKDDGLADFATDRIAQGVFEEGLAEEWLVASEKKRFSNSRCLKASCWSSPVSSVNETMKPSSESSSVVISVRASTTVGLIRKPSFTPSSRE